MPDCLIVSSVLNNSVNGESSYLVSDRPNTPVSNPAFGFSDGMMFVPFASTYGLSLLYFNTSNSNEFMLPPKPKLISGNAGIDTEPP